MSHTHTFSTTNLVKHRTTELIDDLFPPPRDFSIRLWDKSELPAVAKPAFCLILNHPGALRRIFTPPLELSLGEAFIYGDFDIEGDIFSVFPLIDTTAVRTFSTAEVAHLARELFSLPWSKTVSVSGRGQAHRAHRKTAWQKLFERWLVGSNTFIQRYVFPDGELEPVSEVNAIAEAVGFEVRDIENLREHYALTLRHWVNRLEMLREEAVEAVGEIKYRTWRLYMAASVYGFESGAINVNQTLMAKPENGNSHLPLSRADLYG